MIGHFTYAETDPDWAVAVSMSWRDDGQPVGRLHIPDQVLALTQGTDYESIRSGEVFVLPIALGLGVMLAALTHSALCLSGDETVWPREWGRLQPDQ